MYLERLALCMCGWLTFLAADGGDLESPRRQTSGRVCEGVSKGLTEAEIQTLNVSSTVPRVRLQTA